MRYDDVLEQGKNGRIVMAVSNDMLTDQRVDRHRRTLAEAGFDVVVLGRREIPVRHQRGWRFYYEFNRALRRKLKEYHADIIWANDTDTLLGCWMASRRSKARLVMDAHELFPEVPEIQHKPLVKCVWRTLERCLMPQCDALLTVCNSISEYYRLQYGVSMTVVRNVPEAESGKWKEKSGKSEVATLLYQGRVNVGRGVDWAIDALEWLPQCSLVVAGDGDLLEQMKAYAASKPWHDRVSFLGRLMPDELHALTPQADVGLVMLEDMGLNYRYALPNRIGDFIQAGVPMVVSDMPEMRAVIHRYRIGEVMSEPGGRALSESVKRILARGKESYNFDAARREMNWDKEKQLLIKIANELCSTTSF